MTTTKEKRAELRALAEREAARKPGWCGPARTYSKVFAEEFGPEGVLSLLDDMEEADRELLRIRRAMVNVNAACLRCGDSLQKCFERQCCIGCNHSSMS